jgi:competence protein ComEC
LFDLSFQLSFLATTGILLIYPLFKEKKIFRFPVFGDELAITLAAQIGVTPIILLNFDQLSFLSPLINALVLPLIPLLMNLGAIIVFLGFFIKPAAQLLAWLLWLPLTYFTRLIEGFGELSWISWQIKGLSWWWGAGYYFVLGIVLWWVWRKRWRLNQKLF